jgi:hypothetical protein
VICSALRRLPPSLRESGCHQGATRLIYLAKLDALDVFTLDGPAAISEGVRNEVLLPQAAYRFPEIVRIDESVRNGRIEAVSLDEEQRDSVEALSRRVPRLGRGELETIAVARVRRWSAAIADRRAAFRENDGR